MPLEPAFAKTPMLVGLRCYRPNLGILALCADEAPAVQVALFRLRKALRMEERAALPR